MTELLPELASFPAFGEFDGELVAFDRRQHVHIVVVLFDVLSLEGRSLRRGSERPKGHGSGNETQQTRTMG